MGPVLIANSIYRNVYSFFAGPLPDSVAWLAYIIAGVTLAALIATGALLLIATETWMERRLVGRFQSRLGPNRAGPFGVLQPFADVLKLLIKEDTIPRVADGLVFTLAPVVMVAPAILVLAVVPFGKNSLLADLNIGVLYIFAILAVPTLSVFMAGWSSANRYAAFGAMRGVAQLVSYEVPQVLSVVGIVLMAGSLSLVDIVEAQRLPFLLLQPLAFFIFLVGASVEMNRSPFDLPEGESEIVAGYHTEYSGIKFAMFMLVEYGGPVVSGAIIATLFLRGWENPFVPLGWSSVLPSHLWFVLKVLFVMFLFIWIRATLPRLRIDQVLGFAWKVLFPMALINLFVTAAEVLVWPEPTTAQLWAMVGINSGVAVACIVGFSVALERHRRKPTASVTTVDVVGRAS